MDYQEQFFKEQIKVIHEARDAKEDDFEKFQQDKREKVKQLSGNPSAIEDPRTRYGCHFYYGYCSLVSGIVLNFSLSIYFLLVLDKWMHMVIFAIPFSFFGNRAEEVARFIKLQDEEMENFVKAREELIRAHEEKGLAMKQRHWEEEVGLEKEFDDELSKLMEKYTSDRS